MSVDVLVLGLASVVRPTSVAAVYAFLAARSPGPLLAAYLLAGLALSLTVGVAAVAVVHITPPPPTVTTTGRAVADVVLGVLALGAAAYYARRTPPDRPAAPAREPSAMRRRLAAPTVSSAAVAGIATHLPGLFYLGALAAIVSSGSGLVGGLLQVALYNLLWFAIPLAALASWTWYPETTRDSAAQLTTAVQAHRKSLVVAGLALVGVYLVAVGVYDLLTG